MKDPRVKTKYDAKISSEFEKTDCGSPYKHEPHHVSYWSWTKNREISFNCKGRKKDRKLTSWEQEAYESNMMAMRVRAAGGRAFGHL